MRLLPWRAVPPQDQAADKAQLQDRLAKLAKPPVPDAGSATPGVTAQPLAPISPARAKLQELTGGATAARADAPIEPEHTEINPAVEAAAAIPSATQVAAPVPATAMAKPVVAAAPVSKMPRPSRESDRRRRRGFGFLVFSGALILVFFVVRAIPADWEIGPFRIDATGTAADSAASLYFSDDPHAPFWLLVPTFNLPPRFFAVRPNSSGRPIALAPTPSPTSKPSGSASASASASTSPSGSASPSASPSATPSGSASPSVSPSASPGASPSASPSASPTP